MRIKLASLAIVVALICGVSGTSVFANTGSDSKTPNDETKTSSKSTLAAKSEFKPNEKLKGDVSKLLSDAKAGKIAPRPQQFPRTAKNNLSTAAKIGIVAAIGSAIFLIVLFHALSKD